MAAKQKRDFALSVLAASDMSLEERVNSGAQKLHALLIGSLNQTDQDAMRHGHHVNQRVSRWTSNVIMPVTLPDDILHLICVELWRQRDFDTLYRCAVCSRQLAPSALANLYR